MFKSAAANANTVVPSTVQGGVLSTSSSGSSPTPSLGTSPPKSAGNAVGINLFMFAFVFLVALSMT